MAQGRTIILFTQQKLQAESLFIPMFPLEVIGHLEIGPFSQSGFDPPLSCVWVGGTSPSIFGLWSDGGVTDNDGTSRLGHVSIRGKEGRKEEWP